MSEVFGKSLRMASEVWGRMFKCCLSDPVAPSRRARPRIDRSMIGNPTDFRHTGHIGSNDVQQQQGNTFVQLQTQMKSKGGYEMAVYVPDIINARSIDEIRRQ